MMSERVEGLAPQFDSLGQQRHTSTFGMLIFLMTEVMLFGGLFAGYVFYRALYPSGWSEGSQHLNLLLGGINTVVLIVSSLSMALAVHAAGTDQRRGLVVYLALTLVLGLAFLGIKGVEWYQHYVDELVPGIRFTLDSPDSRAVTLFFLFYFLMTGLHAIHMTIGVLLLIATLFLALRGGRFTGSHSTSIEVIGLYWHFVDIIWLFLLPLLYLVGRPG